LVDLSCGGIRHESSFSLYVDFGMERSKHGVSAFLVTGIEQNVLFLGSLVCSGLSGLSGSRAVDFGRIF
jgi:hypothetical protein